MTFALKDRGKLRGFYCNIIGMALDENDLTFYVVRDIRGRSYHAYTSKLTAA